MSETEYSVHSLADLSGVSVRTLHHYDRIGLLPAVRKENNYRSYNSGDVDRLQQILLYKEFGMELSAIKKVLTQPDFDAKNALEEHVTKLKQQRERLDALIVGVEKTLACAEKGTEMSDTEKFEGFKKQLIEENEQVYGTEIREKYGDKTVDASNVQFMGLTEEQFKRAKMLNIEMMKCLARGMEESDPAGSIAQRACDLHRQWLNHYWAEGMYSKEAHLGLGEMYASDERFRTHYDKEVKGTAEFFRDALRVYCVE